MFKTDIFTIGIAGIVIRFIMPSIVVVPEYFLDFLCDNDKKLDVTYRVHLLDKPFVLPKKIIQTYHGTHFYKYENDWIYFYSPLKSEDGCQVLLRINPEGNNTLYYPRSKWEHYSQKLKCLHLLGIERILLQHQSFLLHSSLVKINDQTVLFSGPSGVGKSTQASLWEKHLGAKILNGDRTIVRKIDNKFYGCGSPWAGTSKIYSNEMAPIAGIILLKQSDENKIHKVGIEGFSRLLNQSIVNTWDYEFMNTITSLIGEVLESIPVYELSCRIDEDAVHIAYDAIFKGDSNHDR